MFPTCVHNNLLLGCVCLYIQNVMYVPCQVWSVIRVKFRKQTMLWCLIFHSAELQNYVPALHGIFFFEFSPILFGSSELCSERGYSNYVRQVDW